MYEIIWLAGEEAPAAGGGGRREGDASRSGAMGAAECRVWVRPTDRQTEEIVKELVIL